MKKNDISFIVSTAFLSTFFMGIYLFIEKIISGYFGLIDVQLLFIVGICIPLIELFMYFFPNLIGSLIAVNLMKRGFSKIKSGLYSLSIIFLQLLILRILSFLLPSTNLVVDFFSIIHYLLIIAADLFAFILSYLIIFGINFKQKKV